MELISESSLRFSRLSALLIFAARSVVVRVQMLSELEEIVTYKQNADQPDRQAPSAIRGHRGHRSLIVLSSLESSLTILGRQIERMPIRC